MLKMILGDVI